MSTLLVEGRDCPGCFQLTCSCHPPHTPALIDWRSPHVTILFLVEVKALHLAVLELVLAQLVQCPWMEG
jgi:hypothetical protein